MYNFQNELILRKISSASFIIKTRAIHQLEEQIMQWLSVSTCGAIIYGRARIGKTRAMTSVSRSIKEHYGEEFPVILWDITDHAITEKNFYTSLLMAMGFSQIPRSQIALALKERILNDLFLSAYKTPLKKVVIMIDEAWKFSEKDFSWLMDLYNNLSRKDILLTCFLFGTRELKDFKTELKSMGKDQIIGRFMINEFQFYGIKTMKELGLCLLAFDNMTVPTESGDTSILIGDYYFPDREGSTFFKLSQDYWDAFMELRSKYGIVAGDIPMKYFIDSFIFILDKHGRFGEERMYFPSKPEIIECIEESGYGESDDEYELSKHRKNKSNKKHKRY